MDRGWLQDLEAKVRAASEELRKLRQENRALKKKLQRAAGRPGETVAGGAGDWEARRQEIRKRVEKLAAGLEELL